MSRQTTTTWNIPLARGLQHGHAFCIPANIKQPYNLRTELIVPRLNPFCLTSGDYCSLLFIENFAGRFSRSALDSGTIQFMAQCKQKLNESHISWKVDDVDV